MKIGWVSQALPYLPARDGFRITAGNLIRSLSSRHQIDLISLLENGDAEHLDWARQYCASVNTIPVERQDLHSRALNFFSTSLWGKPLHYRSQLKGLLCDNLRSREWNVLHVEGSFAGGIIPEELPIPKVLSLHDSLTLRYEEMVKFTSSFSRKLRYRLLMAMEPRYERLVYPRFYSCVLVANRDAEAVRKTVSKVHVTVIQDGVDAEYFHPFPGMTINGRLVFHGSLNFAPNIEAVREFANHIFPLIQRESPQTSFHVVGAHPVVEISELASRPAIYLSANLPDLRPAVCSGHVYVCAIRYGTGMKGKILEAMAMGLPIVSYPEAVVGIDAVPGEHLLIARDREEFARQVLELLRHPSRGEHLVKAAGKLVRQKYSWEARARAYEELYEQAIEGQKSQHLK